MFANKTNDAYTNLNIPDCEEWINLEKLRKEREVVGIYLSSHPLEEYKREKKISILLASHNMSEVTRLCQSVLMMKNGKIIDQGKPDDLIAKHGRTNLEEVFLKLSRSKSELY